MRVLLTSDLHHNHTRSRPLADDLIDQINQTPADILILIGDTAVLADNALDACLSRITFPGQKLFVPGNHELWSHAGDTNELLTKTLPQRVESLGWHWLQSKPFITDQLAIVGSLGWYDYSFAQQNLGIPRRFYEAMISPGAAERLEEYAHLFNRTDDISPHAREIFARWNDGKFIRLNRTDEEFLNQLLAQLKDQLDSLRDHPRILAAIHQLPFRELLPPPHTAQWDFAKAYLGSQRIGDLLLQYPNLTDLFCGHSHYPAEAQIKHIHAKNTGCGYKRKFLHLLDV
ncbi:MAG TPA: metallophosphoesterase [Tepidisphaeraceae bacterium]|jgi:predicted phosphohydrolase|nr:metallophosphoesterase [Tepidisphaeraceae bacterium]